MTGNTLITIFRATLFIALCGGAVFLCPANARAEISVDVIVQPEVVPVGAEATLLVRIDGKFRRASEPKLPPLPDFDVYNAGTSQSFSFVNGQRSSSIEYTYVIVPKKEGVYKISPVTFETGGKRYTADPVQIEVVAAASELPVQDAAPRSGAAGGEAPIFIEATVERDTVYVSQQVTWTLGFHTDGTVDMLRSPQYSPPSAEGFWVEDLPPQRNYYREINGTRYLVNEIKRAFFPTVPGIHKIGSARVDIVIDDNRSRRFDDFFRRRLNSFGFGDTKSLTTEEIEIVVLPLPKAGRPADFSGLVGQDLRMTVRADKQVVQAGEPVNVTMEIEGQGNFKSMAAPTIPDLDGFKMYESGSSSDLFKSDYVVAGRKRTDFVVVPREEGETEIPSIRMSYFDPVAKVYRAIESEPVRLTVQPGAVEEGGRQVIFAGSGEDIKVLGSDINFIHGAPATIMPGTVPIYRNGFVLALHALPLLAVAFSLAVERRRRRFRDDTALARSSRAARDASRKLARARQANDQAEAFTLIATALREYFANKMNAAAAGLTTERITDHLAGAGASEEDCQRTTKLFARLDSAQYAPGAASESAVSDVVADSEQIIREFEKRYSS